MKTLFSAVVLVMVCLATGAVVSLFVRAWLETSIR